MLIRTSCAVPVSAIAALLISAAVPAQAVAEPRTTLNFGGVAGLIEMPSGEMMPDGELTATVSKFGPVMRTTLSFQIAPRFQGSFRYSRFKGLALGGYTIDDSYYDRSFDLRFQALTEGEWWPAVTIGLADVGGNGLQSSEYIAATKNVGHGVKVTAGLGWGRLGSHGSFGSIGERPTDYEETGGTFNADRWFRGDVAAFGGIEWQVNDRLGVKFEYSSDGYIEETERQDLFERKSALNFGAEYQVSENVRLGAYYLYGSEFGLSAQFTFNPKRSPAKGLHGNAPMPVAVRLPRASNPGAWTESWAAAGGTAAAESYNAAVSKQLGGDGILLESLSLTARSAEVRVTNTRQDSSAQAIGRTARALAQTLPSSVETFHIVPMADGMPLSRVTVLRSDLERLEFAPNNADALRERVRISDAPEGLSADAVRGETASPRLTYGLGPYLRYSLFDPDAPLRADVGLRASASATLAPGLVLSGSVTGKLAGNMDGVKRVNNSVLPRVRTNEYLRDRRDYSVERLTLAWYARPGADIYSRVSAGYLERGFGGVSGEVLWKPVDSPLAIGAELNYVKQRSFTGTFGFEDYSVATGHVSAYYAFDRGYNVQLDVGRYLAGDVGATLSLDREFENGWKVGAFATLTDVPFSEFGEGSFDKGVRVSIPVSWMLGTPRREKASAVIRPIQRDGGARLNVEGRLYDTVRDYHAPKIDDQWGRVWR